MAPFGWGAWLWLKSNPMAQWALGIGAALIVFRTWLWRRDRRVAKDAQKEIIEQIKEQTDEKISAAEDERRRVRDLNDEQLRKLIANSAHNRGRLRNPPSD